jgi:copper resistance protein D
MSAMDMAPQWSSALLAWPAILAQSLIFGSAMLCMMLNPRAANRCGARGALVQSLRSPWRALALIALVASALMFVGEVAEMAGVTWWQALPLLGEVLTVTHSGHAWLIWLPSVAALPLAAWLPMLDRTRCWILCLLCGAMMFAGSMNSHAIDFGTVALILRFIHALAAGTWSGALFGYWIGTWASARGEHLRIVAAAALSRLAAWSVAILILSGSYMAYEGLGHSLGNLLYSSYGHVLSIKIELFAVILAIGGYNRFVLIPTLDQLPARRALVRNVGAEVLMIVGVIGIAALLASTPPARMSMMMSRVAGRLAQ